MFTRRTGPGPVTHDFTRLGWGHAIHVHRQHPDRTLDVTGHGPSPGPRIEDGDLVLIRAIQPDARTRVLRFTARDVSYYPDPPDMFRATLNYTPTVADVLAPHPDDGVVSLPFVPEPNGEDRP